METKRPIDPGRRLIALAAVASLALVNYSAAQTVAPEKPVTARSKVVSVGAKMSTAPVDSSVKRTGGFHDSVASPQGPTEQAVLPVPTKPQPAPPAPVTPVAPVQPTYVPQYQPTYPAYAPMAAPVAPVAGYYYMQQPAPVAPVAPMAPVRADGPSQLFLALRPCPDGRAAAPALRPDGFRSGTPTNGLRSGTPTNGLRSGGLRSSGAPTGSLRPGGSSTRRACHRRGEPDEPDGLRLDFPFVDASSRLRTRHDQRRARPTRRTPGSTRSDENPDRPGN